MNVKIWYTVAGLIGGLVTFIYVYNYSLTDLRADSLRLGGPPVPMFDPAVFQYALGLSVLFVPIGTCAALIALFIVNTVWNMSKSFIRRRSR